MTQANSFAETPAGRSLAWLADAPLFIDGIQIAALYDAVAKPEYETATIKVNLKNIKSFEVTGEAGGEVEVSAASWLKTIFPFLDAKAKIEAKAGATGNFEKEKGSEIELHPIETPQRQLVQLALHYMANIPDRSLIVPDPAQKDWVEQTFISGLPRSLVFVDFPEKTRFVPMAAELADGEVKTIYPRLVEAFGGPKIPAPRYPEPAYYGDAKQLQTDREVYWKFFEEQFSSTLSIEAVEAVAKGGLLRWIDYRVPLGKGMPFLHMHVQGRGQYDTGTFAYSLVKRGFKHGLRVVGSLKSEPGINVLAIYEK